MRITPTKITTLGDNEIFVFGSNLAGRHGKGAALTALKEFGAILNCGFGPQGRSYAIPTKDERINPLSLPRIADYVAQFLQYASAHPLMAFLVTEIGCGLAGYTPAQIAPMFFPESTPLPQNIWFPASFWGFAAKQGELFPK